ncbi:12119_t:CDS:2 [Cetraspora pellucida]|uniref:12119_t:CDS:1 n=1 Tax=Cetraspora pellucida TaxID=1433469 RepID=A0ACA9KT62_9GLOM|nr:12119_t:CDS:2 [Cetraspora pellucida]
MFARSAYSPAMPLARTTMITENHLTNILAEQLISDFDLKLAQYNAVRNFPFWWQAFKKDWNKVMSANIAPNMDE